MFTVRSELRRQSKNPGIVRFPVVTVIVALIIFVFVMLVGKDGETEKTHLISDLDHQKSSSFDSVVQMNATMEESRSGTDLIWMIPKSPKAVLFLAHGCGGKATDFWDKSPNCPNCSGLPEERLIVLQSLARNFAVVTVSSEGVCWSFGEEKSMVKKILERWISKQKLENLPVFAMGASSGGYFVSALATEFRFKAIALMISEGVYSRLNISRNYPPTIFVHMVKDQVRKRMIKNSIARMRDMGIDVDEIMCKEFALTPEIFSDRIPGIDRDLSLKLFNLLKENGLVDEKGFMKKDGRATPWKAVSRGVVALKKSLYRHVQEEMNVAFGYHEMTSFPFGQILDWFESRVK